MKKIFLGIAIGLALTSLVAATSAIYELKHSTADATQINGVYVYVDSQPASEYELIGTVTGPTLAMDFQYQTIREKLVQRAMKDHPGCNGIIVTIQKNTGGFAQVIKFK